MVIICGCSFSEIETSLVVLSVAGLVMVLLLVVPEVPAEAVVVDLVLVVEAVHPPLVLALWFLFVLVLFNSICVSLALCYS